MEVAMRFPPGHSAVSVSALEIPGSVLTGPGFSAVLCFLVWPRREAGLSIQSLPRVMTEITSDLCGHTYKMSHGSWKLI